MRTTLRAALFTAGLLATTLPVAAHAAKAPTSTPTITRVQHLADEVANAAALMNLRRIKAEQRALTNTANTSAITADRKARIDKRTAGNLANDTARIKRTRVVMGTMGPAAATRHP